MATPLNPPPAVLPTIGLLGAPGSGKSTIARHFAREQCLVIDADLLAREALASDEIRDTLVGWWGPGVASPSGEVDRKAVGEIVFADPEQRRRLEGVIHPYVNRRRDMIRRDALRDPSAGVVAFVEDCPLLLETGLDKECDALVFVDCPLEDRQARVLESRGWSAAELAAREAAQMPLDTKRASSDYTIDNVGDAEAIQRRVRDVLQDILQTYARARAAQAPH